MNAKMIMMMESLRSFVKREDGASAIEYALIAGLIAVGIIVAATGLGEEVSNLFDRITEHLTGATGT